MKKLLSIVLLASGLATSAQAVLVGVEAGYLTNNKDSYLSARVGYEFRADSAVSHQLAFEIGYTEHRQSIVPLASSLTATTKLTPVTLNYRAEFGGVGKFGYYVGAGIGFARTSTSLPGSGVQNISQSDTNTAVQVFGGVAFEVSSATTLHLGLKYLWLGDTHLSPYTVRTGDDLAITAGASFKF